MDFYLHLWDPSTFVQTFAPTPETLDPYVDSHPRYWDLDSHMDSYLHFWNPLVPT